MWHLVEMVDNHKSSLRVLYCDHQTLLPFMIQENILPQMQWRTKKKSVEHIEYNRGREKNTHPNGHMRVEKTMAVTTINGSTLSSFHWSTARETLAMGSRRQSKKQANKNVPTNCERHTTIRTVESYISLLWNFHGNISPSQLPSITLHTRSLST